MTRPAARIHQSLDAITQAILTGDLAGLSGLTVLLEEDLTRHQGDLDRESLEAMQKKVDRNAALLRAAQRGLRAAQRRLAEIRGVSQGLTTYDAQGLRATRPQSGLADRRA